jgi:hypothetical protein
VKLRAFSSLKGRALAAGALVATPFLAMAEPSGPDWSTLTDAIDFGTLGVGLLAAGAALIGVYLTIKGVRIIIGMVRS